MIINTNQKDFSDFAINVNFNNKCNKHCSYCFKDSKISELSNQTLYQKIRKISDSLPEDKNITFCFGSMCEVVLSKNQLFKFIDDIPYFMGYFFTEKDFKNISAFLSEVNLSSLNDLNNLICREDFYQLLQTNIKPDKNFESRKDYHNEKYNIIWRNAYLLRLAMPEHFITKKPPYCTLSFMSNGTILDDEFLTELKSKYVSNPDDHCIGISISIDGPEDLHDKLRGKGSYKAAMATVEKLAADPMIRLTHVSATITNQIDDLFEYFKFFYDNFGKRNINVVFSFVRDHPEYWYNTKTIKIFLRKLNKFYKEIVKKENTGMFLYYFSNRFLTPLGFMLDKVTRLFRCNLYNTVYIEPDGTISNCFNGHLRVNITKDDTISPINHNQIMSPYNVFNIKLCKSCKYKTLCGGPCYSMLLTDMENVKAECILNKFIIKKCKRIYKKTLKTLSTISNNG